MTDGARRDIVVVLVGSLIANFASCSGSRAVRSRSSHVCLTMTTPTVPPRYVIISQATLNPDAEAEIPATTLIHPQIHYQYADDPPTAIPMSIPPEAQTVYMDFDPNEPSRTQVRSASGSIVATGLAVSDAVGALPIENSHLYIVSTGELQTNSTRE